MSEIDLSNYHRFFPIMKMTYLHILKNGKPKTTREMINALPNSRPTTIIRELWKYRHQGLIKRNKKEDEWIITNQGKKLLKYLKERLETEFHGYEGLNNWIEEKQRENRARWKEEQEKKQKEKEEFFKQRKILYAKRREEKNEIK